MNDIQQAETTQQPLVAAVLPTTPAKPSRSAEVQAARHFKNLKTFIEKHEGRFMKDSNDNFYLALEGKRISLQLEPSNYGLASLLLDACGISTVGQAARATIQRLQVHAFKQAGHLELRHFSAMSKDRKSLYLPLTGGQLLQIKADAINRVENGDATDNFWLEHPRQEPLDYKVADSKAGLADFERLLVDTQACTDESLKWFVAMAEGIFPYLRDLCPCRLILLHRGPTQQGKTSGAQRFTLLHGLGQVKGDYSDAALGNMHDCGLLVLDNKEHANFTPGLTDYLVLAATGAERGRSSVDGHVRVSAGERPVVVVTSIEGVFKAELQSRCVEVNYAVKGAMTGRRDIESEIEAQRHEILSAVVQVLQRFLRRPRLPCPTPIPQFEEHVSCLCDLLRAFGETAGKPADWAEGIIREWGEALSNREQDGDELENLLAEVLRKAISPDFAQQALEHNGQPGKLYVTQAGRLLTLLQKEAGYPTRASLPKTASALSSRLDSCRFESLVFLTEKHRPDVEALKRRGSKRSLGLWVPD